MVINLRWWGHQYYQENIQMKDTCWPWTSQRASSTILPISCSERSAKIHNIGGIRWGQKIKILSAKNRHFIDISRKNKGKGRRKLSPANHLALPSSNQYLATAHWLGWMSWSSNTTWLAAKKSSGNWRKKYVKSIWKGESAIE